jgi:hypothetical protein
VTFSEWLRIPLPNITTRDIIMAMELLQENFLLIHTTSGEVYIFQIHDQEIVLFKKHESEKPVLAVSRVDARNGVSLIETSGRVTT